MMNDLAVTVPLRWSDQDRNGHVNNAAVVTLLEESRVAWRATAMAEGGLDASTTGLILVSLTVAFVRPVMYGEDVVIRVAVAATGRRSVTLRHVGRQSDAVVFEATSVVVLNSTDGTRTITAPERAYLSAAPAAVPTVGTC